jgi:hypothetical protein
MTAAGPYEPPAFAYPFQFRVCSEDVVLAASDTSAVGRPVEIHAYDRIVIPGNTKKALTVSGPLAYSRSPQYSTSDVFLRRDGKSRQVESLLFLDSSFSLRSLRAYANIKDQTVQRQLVSLMVSIAANDSSKSHSICRQ